MRYTSHEQMENGLRVETDEGILELQVITASIVRIVATDGTPIPDPGQHSPLIVGTPAEDVAWGVSETSERVSVTTPSLRVDLSKETCALTWRDADGNTLIEEPATGGKELRRVDPADLATDDEVVSPRESLDRPAYSTKLALDFDDDEAILGLGQHEGGLGNYRGESQQLYQANTKVAMPAFVSSKGYGLLWDATSLSTFHDDQHGSYVWTECVDALDFYVVHGPEPDDVVSGFRTLTGQSALAPKWAYGYVQSKERYETQDELLDVLDEYRDREIPIDVLVQDWQYWPDSTESDPDFEEWGGPAGDWGQWGQKSFNEERFPDPTGLLEELHSRDTRLMISIWPNTLAGENYEEMREAGHVIDDENIASPANEQRYYDVFSDEARSIYWQQARDGLFDHGVDAWWCDSTEPYDPDWTLPTLPEPGRRTQHATDTLKGAIDPGYINAYSIFQAKGMYDGQRSVTDQKRVLNLTRSGSPGQHRYGAITWSGDIEATWDRYEKQIADGLQFTATGNPKWTLDVGGFYVEDGPSWITDGDFEGGVDNPGYRELYVRWFQFGTFLPMLRSHGTDTPREVWRFGEPGDRTYDTLVRFIELRYRLLPYLYSLAGWETHRDYTATRHLAFEFPDDERTHDIADQFMCGPSLMVSPVTKPMYFDEDGRPFGEDAEHGWDETPAVEAWHVYLPEGTAWYDFWTGKRYDGGQTVLADAPLDRVPIFVRAGTVLPLGDIVQHTNAAAESSWTVRVYPGRDGDFDIYEDAGDGYGYEDGEYAFTPLEWDDPDSRLTIGDRQGTFPELTETRTVRIATVSNGNGVGVEHADPNHLIEYQGEETVLPLDL